MDIKEFCRQKRMLRRQSFWMSIWRVSRFIRRMRSGSAGSQKIILAVHLHSRHRFVHEKVLYLLSHRFRFERGGSMLLNNVELDLKTKFIEEKVTQTEIADKVGVSLS